MAEKHENLWISALKDWICDKYVIFLLLFTFLIILKDIGILSDLLIKVIGKDKLANLDSDTLYFMTSILNELNLDSIRNNLLLEVLPLKI